MGRRRLDERRRLRVERYLLTLRRHGHQPQLEDSAMSTETEALRAQFERQCRGLDLSRNEDGVYTDEFVYVAWIHYQKGHAAAKAETARVEHEGRK